MRFTEYQEAKLEFESSVYAKRVKNVKRLQNRFSKTLIELESLVAELRNTPSHYEILNRRFLDSYQQELDYRLLICTSSIVTFEELAEECLQEYLSYPQYQNFRERMEELNKDSFAFLRAIRNHTSKYGLVEWVHISNVSGTSTYLDRDNIVRGKCLRKASKRFLDSSPARIKLDEIISEYHTAMSDCWDKILDEMVKLGDEDIKECDRLREKMHYALLGDFLKSGDDPNDGLHPSTDHSD